MEPESDFVAQAAPPGKVRIPKACNSCRQSKVKCDREKPCSRCKGLGKQCIWFEQRKDPTVERLDNLESEVQRLSGLLEHYQQNTQKKTATTRSPRSPPAVRQSPGGSGVGEDGVRQEDYGNNRSVRQSIAFYSPQSTASRRITARDNSIGDRHNNNNANDDVRLSEPSQGYVSIDSLLHPTGESSSLKKRSRSEFELRDEPIADVVTRGLVPIDRARLFFYTFFQGCDRYIPIFDPCYDTFDSIRSRSSILLNAICTIGCRVDNESGSEMAELLNAELKRWINAVILDPKMSCLESVQAMLVVACYSAERSLILSFATRMALDLKLPDEYEVVTQRLAMRGSHNAVAESSSQHPGGSDDERGEASLVRKSRTWFGLLVLEHIFRVDAGKLPGMRSKGDIRRCRLLLNHPASTALDLRLLSQVELNVLRAKLNDTLSASTGNPGEIDIVEFVQDARIDIGLWYTGEPTSDWSRIVESSTTAGNEKPFLAINLRIQKCWAEMMVQCKAVRHRGVQNVAVMSPTERDILLMAKRNAKEHLEFITGSPEYYLSTFKYAMDFVWAKCAFCFLLLLKLSQLVPEDEEDGNQLLQRGNRLLHELSTAGSDDNCGGNSNNNIYLQILKLSIEKYGRALREYESDRGAPSSGNSTLLWDLFGAQADLQSFVPEQFIFEWDFPGLNLFYFPTTWQDFFGDFAFGI